MLNLPHLLTLSNWIPKYSYTYLLTYLLCKPWRLCVCRILWTAGAVAAIGSITYPAISVYVSANASPDQQGQYITLQGLYPVIQ